MRKIAVCILAVMMLVLNSGLSIHMHFCMGKVVRVAFSPENENSRCRRCGMEKQAENKGCCEDVQKIFKTDEGKLIDAASFVHAVFDAILPIPALTHNLAMAILLPDAYRIPSPIFVPPDIGHRYPLYISSHALLI